MASQHTCKVEILRVVLRFIALLSIMAIVMAVVVPAAFAQAPPVRFAKAVAYPSGGAWVYSVAVADLNGDGHPDLVVANLCGNYNCYSYPWQPPGIGRIGVLLGNGDGTFQSPVVYNSGGYDSYSVAIGDVNGDGHPDLVVANLCETSTCNNGSVSVLLGNGDGTFQPAVSYSWSEHYAMSVAIADVNGDGHVDLVAGNTCPSGVCGGGSVGVFLGNGDGTFQRAVSYSSGGSSAVSIAIGDMNGDGKPDLIAVNDGVSVLLNNGDGTFRPPVTYASGGFLPLSVAIADVNGDGKSDLVVANCGSTGACGNGVVGVLLGNGDGTFQPTVSYGSGSFAAMSVAIADLNGDGHADLAVAGGSGLYGYLTVLVGNGDGTFQSPVTYSSGSNNGPGDSIAIADVNGDGRPDVLVGNWGSDVVGVLLNDFTAATTTKVTSSLDPSFIKQPVTFTATVISTSSVPDGQVVTFYAGTTAIGTSSIKGGVATFTTPSLSAGTHGIRAAYSGDPFHKGSSGTVKQVVNLYPSSTTLASSLNPSIYGQTVTFTATVTTTGSAPLTGNVAFTWSGRTIGTSTLNSSGVATLTISKLNADPYPMTAVYNGDANNSRSTSLVLNQVVQQTTSAATITASPNPSTLGQAVTFTAKITSPTVTPTGPVTFTAGKAVLGTVQLSNGKATFTTTSLPVGSTVVTVTFNGDSNIQGSSASVTQVVK